MKIAKAVIAGTGAIVSILTLAFADDVVNASEAGTITAVIVEQAIMVWGVFQIRNKGYVHTSDFPQKTTPGIGE